MGDGYCDDYVNNVECSWDNGDCCGDNVDKTYCTQCQCLDPKHQGGMYSSFWKSGIPFSLVIKSLMEGKKLLACVAVINV